MCTHFIPATLIFVICVATFTTIAVPLKRKQVIILGTLTKTTTIIHQMDTCLYFILLLLLLLLFYFFLFIFYLFVVYFIVIFLLLLFLFIVIIDYKNKNG